VGGRFTSAARLIFMPTQTEGRSTDRLTGLPVDQLRRRDRQITHARGSCANVTGRRSAATVRAECDAEPAVHGEPATKARNSGDDRGDRPEPPGTTIATSSLGWSRACLSSALRRGDPNALVAGFGEVLLQMVRSQSPRATVLIAQATDGAPLSSDGLVLSDGIQLDLIGDRSSRSVGDDELRRLPQSNDRGDTDAHRGRRPPCSGVSHRTRVRGVHGPRRTRRLDPSVG
jgi:hypothetical protein